MAKFFGKVGFSIAKETVPGVWTEEITEREYFGEFIKKSSRWESSGHLNDNLEVSGEISIVTDPFAYWHFSEMKYVEFMGAKWKIKSVSPERPRLSLTIGGLYNG